MKLANGTIVCPLESDAAIFVSSLPPRGSSVHLLSKPDTLAGSAMGSPLANRHWILGAGRSDLSLNLWRYTFNWDVL